MASPAFTEDLNQQAARWAKHAHYGERSDELDAWLASDRRHRGAYLRARAALYVMQDAVLAALPHDEAERRPDAPAHAVVVGAGVGWARRRWRETRGFAIGGTMLAASLAAVIILVQPGQQPMRSARPPASAAASNMLELKDGSVARLSPGADLTFTVRDGVRNVVLLRGEATFHVAKDRAHPFVVRSGDVYAQATGTIYSVQRLGETGGAVRVDEGSVLVWGRDERDQAVLLHAGGRMTLDPGAKRAAVPRSENTVRPAPPPVVAQISLDDVTIDAAARRFNGLNHMQIIVGDPSIGNIRIVGLFEANDPEQFAKAAATLAGADVNIYPSKDVIKLTRK